MAIDPRKLKPSELCRLLNSTPLGEVIGERQLHRHRTRAGYRIGDGRTVDLLRYAAWPAAERHERKAEEARQPEGLTGYDAMRERARERNAMLSLSGRDIGGLPPVVNPERKAMTSRCRHFHVVYTRRGTGGRIIRRRECHHCGRRITTAELEVGRPHREASARTRGTGRSKISRPT